MPPDSRPHLPRDFLAKLIAEPCMKDKKSYIFTKEFHATRLKLADHNQTAVNAESNIAGFSGGFFRTMDEDKRGASTSTRLSSRHTAATPVTELYREYSFLHMAVDETDPPLACEMIRHGTLIDKENYKGQTPLMQALERTWELHSFLKQKVGRVPLPPTMQGYKMQIENAQKRVRSIAVILIEQHANVNTTVDWEGKVVSSLHLACAMDDWDLVALLLGHGAECKPNTACIDVGNLLGTAASKRRFKALEAKAQGAARPLRVCPCFSGKPMAECHSKRLPYPDDFTCSCGSGKVYGKCCKARNIVLTEIWDEETKWIQPSRKVSVPFGAPPFASPEVHAVMEQVKQNGDMEKVMKMVPEAMFNPEVRSVFDECLEIGCQENIADPAFTFAYFDTKYFPSPQGRSSSKHWCRQKQKEWNAAVDKYIASGVDSRPRFEIEEAAKIGISLGAMYRACEADGCDKVEGRDTEKMLTCARCKMIFYCGPTCQKLHWRAHKKVCGTVEQTERPLPSQVALSDFVCKYSPGLMLYRMGDERFDGLKFDDDLED